MPARFGAPAVAWNGLGEEPMTDDEWREHLRSISDDELEAIALYDGLVRNRHDAQDERDRRAREMADG